jgi:DNA-binding CsgD family transcriptional regulator
VLEKLNEERRIAELVSRGRTNHEVADQLHLSHKTVEWTLTRVYRKLRVRSRTELAAKLAGAQVRGFPRRNPATVESANRGPNEEGKR